MKIRFLTLGLIFCLFVGCSPGRESRVYTTHYIGQYFATNGIRLEVLHPGTFYGITIYTVSTPTGASVDKAEYEALSEKHGDMTYNRYVSKRSQKSPGYTNADFVSISITSNADYDELHPAGAELGDIVAFFSWSPIKYIRSGYTEPYTGVFHKNTPDYLIMLDAASDLTPDDMILLGDGKGSWLAELSFTQHPPTIAKSHNIKVTMVTDDGRVFSDTVQVTWE